MAQIAQDWQKVVAERVQEKVKAKQKTTKNQVLLQRWLAFQEASRQKEYIEEKAKDLYAFQKLKHELKDNVILLNEANRKYIATTIWQAKLAKEYLGRLEGYQRKLSHRLDGCEEVRARLGIKIKTEKSTSTKKKVNQSGLDHQTIRKKLIQFGVDDEMISNNLEMGSRCVEMCEISEVGQVRPGALDEQALEVGEALLLHEFRFPKVPLIPFSWLPSEKILTETVEHAYHIQFGKDHANTKGAKKGKLDNQKRDSAADTNQQHVTISTDQPEPVDNASAEPSSP